MRDGHPDDDQLADLAADVLPLAEARAVEAHVMACERCSLLLADAERIRGLLVAGDPGPMPPDVWARIEAALAGAGAGAGTPPPLVPVHAERAAGPAGPAAGEDDADPFDTSAEAPFDTPHRHGGSRAARGSVTSRREARPSGRRHGRTLAAVVGLAAAALVGVVTVKALPTGESSAGTAAIAGGGDSSSPASAPAGGQAAGADVSAVPYERTGTAYTAAGLARQAQGLTRARAGGGASAAPAPATPVVPGASRATQRFAQAPDPTATDISNPANLDGCLTALKTSRDRLVAVDLATYDDREAAVLLLRASGGGYEVFVVERTCSAADDHTLGYAAVKG
jgi:hypothetical protein